MINTQQEYAQAQQRFNELMAIQTRSDEEEQEMRDIAADLYLWEHRTPTGDGGGGADGPEFGDPDA